MAKILDALRSFITGPTPHQEVVWSQESLRLIEGLTVEELWRTQPYLRTVVTFVARNIAHLGLHTFERVSDTDRRRVKDNAVAQLLARPNPDTTLFELINATVSDYKLHDVAYWLLTEVPAAPSGWEIRQIPPRWVTGRVGGSVWGPSAYKITHPNGHRAVEVPADSMIVFHGWNPSDPSRGASPVEALRGLLVEQINAQAYRTQVWQRGGRVGTVMTRPAQSPKWTDEQRTRFANDWKAKWTGNDGPKAGGTPILEDGMELKRIGFSAKEDEWAEVAKLSLAMVASVYHVNPTMVGLLDNANFSNVREFRRMLYGDTLGPDLAMIEARLNTFLVPKVAPGSDVYVEFNIGEKLQGSFEEQAAALQSAVGGPWRTRNEARALENLPAVEGGDELITPLNVLIGGQASPRDGVTGGGGGGTPELAAAEAATPSGYTADDIAKLVSAANGLIRSGFAPEASLTAVGLDPIEHLGLLPVTVQKPSGPDGEIDDALVDDLTGPAKALPDVRGRVVVRRALSAKAEEAEPAEVDDVDERQSRLAQTLATFFERQKRAVLSAMGAKAAGEWWDEERWNAELADDLLVVAQDVTAQVGADTAESLGFTADDYDVDRTLAFLEAVAKSRSALVNQATRERIAALLDDADTDLTPTEAAGQAFDEATSTRAPEAAVTLLTTFVAFAATEAAKQTGGDSATKTWVVTSKNPRSSHARIDGETVPIDDAFSNGMAWPGDPAGGADEVAGCQCTVEVNIP